MLIGRLLLGEAGVHIAGISLGTMYGSGRIEYRHISNRYQNEYCIYTCI
jgi:hypothetical protein